MLSNLNEFMVTEFRTLFTIKYIDVAATVMQLVREFNQVCQVFADNVNQRYGYGLELQGLDTWRCQNLGQAIQSTSCTGTGIIECQSPTASYGWQPGSNFPNGRVCSHHNKPNFNHKWGSSWSKQKQPADNYAKRQESGTHTPDDQVKAGMYKSGHPIDPVREELNHLQGVADKLEQHHQDNKQ